jgi:hypothetical protein
MTDFSALVATLSAAAADFSAKTAAANASRSAWIAAQRAAGVYEPLQVGRFGGGTAPLPPPVSGDLSQLGAAHAANLAALATSSAAYHTANSALQTAIRASVGSVPPR